ncbi:hypothetical protein BCR34DRAFT_586326 [Clohesyomyces aquaticus]|uniref:Amidohydrolase-related domain-containing protein n=1 Tax=Clohesyomyces aquaticus TaxID=1231657 RepID=A0A1Y1ZU22_9PLEO|nr:hypothetical protein BCR34DRAFT_586326 [Clohesyomyces aquaticus]
MSTSSQPIIGIEEYFLFPDIPTSASQNPSDPALNLIPAPILTKLKTIGPARIRDMRTAGFSMQILSHLPLDLPLKTCQKINDTLYSKIVTTPDRIAALAILPMGDAGHAANELQRCVTQYKFVGGMLGFRRIGAQIDMKEWSKLWSMAEKYKVPVTLRPVWPSNDEADEFWGPFSQSFTTALISGLYSHHTVSPLLLLRLYASGMFDRHPQIRIVLSQNGHSIPTLLPRIEALFSTVADPKPIRKFSDVWQYNIYVSTTDVLDVNSLRALVENIPVDRVLWAGNYPWEEKGGKDVLWESKEVGILEREEFEAVAWRNAEKLFGVKVGPAEKPIIGARKSSLRGRRASFG